MYCELELVLLVFLLLWKSKVVLVVLALIKLALRRKCHLRAVVYLVIMTSRVIDVLSLFQLLILKVEKAYDCSFEWKAPQSRDFVSFHKILKQQRHSAAKCI